MAAHQGYSGYVAYQGYNGYSSSEDKSYKDTMVAPQGYSIRID